MPQPTLIKTIGCELEFAKSLRSEASNIIYRKFPGWEVVHDGSCAVESYLYPDTDEPTLHCASEISPTYGIRRVYKGGELVSPTIDTTCADWFVPIENALALLEKLEDGHIDPTTSIHVHVNVGGRGMPLRYFRNLVKLTMYIEDALFRLSCADTKTHRGLTNQFLYCRPNSKPPCVHTYTRNDETRICTAFSNEKLLSAETLVDVQKALGRSDIAHTKYIPPRYVGINFVSLFTLGSIEFRTFNSTFNPTYVKSWIELSRHLVELSFNDLAFDFDSLQPHPLGEQVLDLGEFIETLWIPSDLASSLEVLWNMGTFSAEPDHIMTHVSASTIDWSGVTKLRPAFIDSDLIVPIPHTGRRRRLLTLHELIDIPTSEPIDDSRIEGGIRTLRTAYPSFSTYSSGFDEE